MSFLINMFRRLIEAACIFFIIAYLPGLLPDMQFTAYRVTEPKPLEGPLAMNERLNKAEKLYVGKAIAPEGFAVENDTLYTGLKDGNIVKLYDKQLSTIANIRKPCSGPWDVESCGRPLGLAFDKHHMLYVVDAYYGIYKINPNTGTVQHVISTLEPIEGKRARIANSVTVGSDGTIYWTSSSDDVGLHDGVLTLLADGSGRVFAYDPIKKVNKVLMEKLKFANGILLSKKEDFLIISETQMCRLLRYWLKGPKKGETEILIDGLPGMTDNLQRSASGTIYVPLIFPRSKEMPSIPEVIAPYPIIRRFLAKLFTIIELPFQFIQMNFPNQYSGIITFSVNNFEIISPILPKRLTIVEINEEGEIVGSYHSTDKNVVSVSDFAIVDGIHYLGSPFNDFLGSVTHRIPIRIKLSDITPPPDADNTK